MIKKFMKKASVCVLAFMLSLSIIPLKTVHAASIKAANLKTGDTISAGDVFGSLEFLESFSYSDEDGISLATDTLNSSLPYTVKSEVGGKSYSHWKITSINKNGTVYTISVMGVLTPTATASDLTITGAKGVEIEADQNIRIDFTNLPITTAEGSDVTSWFTNMPAGLTAKLKINDAQNKLLGITISGTPTETKNEIMNIIIPASAFGGSEDLTVTTNANVKFAIGERKATINNIEIKGVIGEKVDKDITINLENDQLNIGHMDITKKPVTNLPNGIQLGFGSYSNDHTFRISVYGTPTVIENGTIELTIPGEWLKSGKDLKVTVNANATYTIKNIGVTTGTNTSHKMGSNTDLTFKCDGKLENLIGIYVDGALVDASNYTLQSGSTILTLKASYLNTLSSGTHTVKFQYKDNISSEIDFKVLKDDRKSETPETGDTTTMMLSFSMLIVSGGILAILLKKRKAETH